MQDSCRIIRFAKSPVRESRTPGSVRGISRKGYVYSTWGGVNSRVADLKAGLDLEMPSSDGKNDRLIVEAVRDGALDEAVLDQAVYRILSMFEKYEKNRSIKAVFDMEKDHKESKLAEDECAVLLKNEEILPLKKEQKIGVIGDFACHPRFQGGGSANVNAQKVSGAYEILKAYVRDIRFAKGFSEGEEQKEEWIEEALDCASWADAAIIFAGLPEAYESEGMDRTHMKLPQCQNQLIEEVLRIQPNTVVVLHNGSPVEMPWADKVKGILEMYLGGEAVGESAADILMGRVNPSGRLSETFPLRLEDTPSYLNFPGERDHVCYREGIFVGYRYYDKKKLPVLFPFGHGLSYTEFTYSNLQVSSRETDVPEQLKVTVDITNTGSCAGKEVVQLYVSDAESSVIRPEKELKGFEKIYLEPGETKTVCFSMETRAFAFYSEKIHDWYVEEGIYKIMIAHTSADIRLETEVMIRNPKKLPVKITLDTTFQELFEYPEVMEAVKPLRDLLAERFQKKVDSDQGNERAMRMMLGGMPLRGALSFNHSDITVAQAEKMVRKANQIMEAVKNG